MHFYKRKKSFIHEYVFLKEYLKWKIEFKVSLTKFFCMHLKIYLNSFAFEDSKKHNYEFQGLIKLKIYYCISKMLLLRLHIKSWWFFLQRKQPVWNFSTSAMHGTYFLNSIQKPSLERKFEKNYRQTWTKK